MREIWNRKKNIIVYLLIYTIGFVTLYYVCYGQWFFKYNKALFRSYDGLNQHYLIFIYIGKLGRQIIKSLLIDHKLSIPLWNMGIGYGADVFTSIGAYLPDPFNWISVFIPTRYSEIGYSFSIILKLYLSGLAFSFFAHEKKLNYFQGLVGSIVYVFSGTALVIFIEPFFMNPLYLFPFVIIGIDRLWENKMHFKMYVIFLTLIFANYFYFGYMSAILIVGYCIIKFYCQNKEERRIQKLLQLVVRFLLYSLLAVGLSMVVVLPIALVIMDAERIGADFYVPKVFPQWYYSGIIAGFTTEFNMLGRDCDIGYGVISLPCVVGLFLCKNKYKNIKIEFILLTIGLCIPYFGKIMNGFGYSANRWVWAYALLVAYIVALVIPMFRNLDFNQRLIVGLGSITYVVVVCAVYDNHSSMAIASAMALFFITIILLNVKTYKWEVYRILSVSITAISVVITNYYVFNKNHGNFTREWVERNSGVHSLYDNEINKLLKEVGAKNSDRYDKSDISVTKNVSWLYGLSGMDFYISIYNNNIDKFHNAVSLVTSSAPMDYQGLNRRSDLSYLMGVKHFFIPGGENWLLPYGYNTFESAVYTQDAKKYESYTTSQKNSLVHGLNYLISEDEYKKYTPYEKQQLLMRAGMVQGIDEQLEENLEVADDEVKFKITNLDNVIVRDDTFEVGTGGGTLTLSFDDICDKELYVWLDGLDYENGEEAYYQISMQAIHGENDIEFTREDAGFSNNKSHMYGGRHSWMFNLGLIKETMNGVTITFFREGKYKVDQIKIYGESEERIEKNIKNLPSLTDNVIISNNSISFDLESTKDKYMLLSIPYSTGWVAYVDGEKRAIRKCDDAFILLNLEKQDKHVELKYFTPGLLEGGALTVFSLLIFGFLAVKEKKVKKE